MPFLTTLGLIAGGAGAVNNFLMGGKMAREAQQGLQTGVIGRNPKSRIIQGFLEEVYT